MTRSRAAVALPAAALLIALLVVGSACSTRGAGPTATPTVTATAAPTTVATPVATPTPTPTPTPAPTMVITGPRDFLQQPFGIAVIDLAAGHMYPIVGFDGGAEVVSAGRLIALFVSQAGGEALFEWSGAPVMPKMTPTLPRPVACVAVSGQPPISRVAGARYDIPCGVFSPTGDRMLYHLPPLPAPGGTQHAHVLDVATGGSTAIDAALLACGGCGGRAQPAWSPSGRYVLDPESDESAKGGRVFLLDTKTAHGEVVATSTVGARPIVEAGQAPSWAPDRDALVFPKDGAVHVGDLASGAESTMDDAVAWPARFDASGRFVYAQAVATPAPTPRATTTGSGTRTPTPPTATGTPTATRAPAATPTPPTGPTVVIADARTGKLVSQLPGIIGERPFAPEQAVGANAEGPVAALTGVEGCAGVVIYARAATGGRCFPGAARPAVSPQGRVAFSRASGGGREIDVVDPATLEAHRVADGPAAAAPLLLWSPSGEQIVVAWPGHYGE